MINQRVECTAYRLGTDKEHFKHKYRNCNTYVYDGSMVNEPYKLRRPFNYYVKITDSSTGDTYGANGKKLGRPRKPQPIEPAVKKPRGRPRKNPTI